MSLAEVENMAALQPFTLGGLPLHGEFLGCMLCSRNARNVAKKPSEKRE